ncbi:hypothetical protein WR25_23807 [Diploscapter pachys]|uniref:F-box domain-containing protein n=1 Tax=Diploscapter pachys TaxID=2018661 RepID=A0A2A2KVC9_9BILA|nr:hypothetical protein WR25_23807 [Diploscapter pachys]
MLALELQIKNGTNYIKECNCSNVNFQIFCTILTRVESIDLLIYRLNEQDEGRYEEDTWKNPNSCRITIWSDCCERYRRYIADNAQNGYDLAKPAELMEKVGKMHNLEEIRIRHRTIQEAISKFLPFLTGLTDFYLVKRFKLNIGDDARFWHEHFAPFLTNNPGTIRRRPDVELRDLQINADEFFACRLFWKGIRSVCYINVSPLERSDEKSIYHGILKTAKIVQIIGDNLQIEDNDLLVLFGVTVELHLLGQTMVTAGGISELIKNLYNNRQPKNKNAIIKSGNNIWPEETFSTLPYGSCEILVKNEEEEIEMIITNKFNQKWKIYAETVELDFGMMIFIEPYETDEDDSNQFWTQASNLVSYASNAVNNLTIMVRHKSLGEALSNFFQLLLKITNFYVVKEFILSFQYQIEMWSQLSPFFEEHPLLTRCRPSVSFSTLTVNINDFFDHPFFARGLDKICFHRINVNNDQNDKSMYHEIMKTVKYVFISQPKIPLDDDKILSLFENTPLLDLRVADKITPNGVARFVKSIYENHQAHKRNIRIMTTEKLEFMDFLSLIPENSYETNNDSEFKSVVITNKFEKIAMICNFPIEIVEEILQYIGIHDLISTIKVNRRLYSIAHSAKSPLRHRLVKKAFDLKLKIWVTPGIANELCEFFFAEVVQIHGERLSANGEDILRLFNKATFLELRILSQMDTDGIIQIIQNFYENHQGKRRHVFIDIERRLDYSYIFARAPGIIDGQQSIPNSCVMKNKFDEMWEISVKQHSFEIKSHDPKSLQHTSNQ